MRRPVFPIAALLLLAAALAPARGADNGSQAPSLRSLVRPGERAPAFALRDLDGRNVSVAPGGDKASLIVFFSAFCPLCRELAPAVAEIAGRCGPTLRVVGVNLDGPRFSSAVRSFVAEYRIGFPVLLDEIRDDMFLASDPYGVEKTPTAVLIDRDGAVRGAYAADAMKDAVRELIRTCPGSKKGDRVAN